MNSITYKLDDRQQSTAIKKSHRKFKLCINERSSVCIELVRTRKTGEHYYAAQKGLSNVLR